MLSISNLFKTVKVYGLWWTFREGFYLILSRVLEGLIFGLGLGPDYE